MTFNLRLKTQQKIMLMQLRPRRGLRVVELWGCKG
jgi:hypothetical protein